MHHNSELLFKRYALPYFTKGLRVLEIGPDAWPSSYQLAAAVDGLVWSMADLATSSDALGRRFFGQGADADLTYIMESENDVPAPDDYFDIVLSGQVIEHVSRVWIWMRELARICKPGGYIITLGPISWPYHEAPVDCWRIYPEGMRALSEDAGLDVLQSKSECLRERMPRRSYLGADLGRTSGVKALLKAIAEFLGWPMPIVVDTITIAQKPLPARTGPLP